MQFATQGRLALLSRASQVIGASLVLDEVLGNVVQGLLEVSGAERGFLALLDEDEASGDLKPTVGRTREGASIPSTELQLSRPVVEAVLSSGRPLMVTDPPSAGGLAEPSGGSAGRLRCILAAPLMASGRTIGVLYADSPPGGASFQHEDLDLLSAFASQAAIAIDHVRQFEALGQRVKDVEALREYQDNILSSAGSAIIALDASGHITSFNPPAARVFGVSAEEVIGKPYHGVLGPELSARLLRRMLRVMGQGERPDVLELDGPVAGRRTVLRITMSPLRQVSDGRALGLVLVADDLTDARLLEEARAREEAEKERVRSIFGRYVAPEVVDQILAGREHLQLGGKRQQVSVLFADVRGYTTWSEHLPPEEVVNLLNRYLAVATKAIFDYGGTLDKYMGDAVMAVFNAPLPQPDHALAAVRAAWAMQQAVSALETEGPSLGYGIGVTTGEAIAGNIGTEQLMNYTVIGDTVNVASRIQALAPAGQTFIAEGTYEQVKELVDVEPLPPVQVKGRLDPVAVFRLLGVRSP